MSNDFLSSLGIKIQDIVAGFAGGISISFAFKESKPWAIVGNIVVGGLAANYLGMTVSRLLSLPVETGSFAVGLAGMVLCQGVAEKVGSMTLFKGRGE